MLTRKQHILASVVALLLLLVAGWWLITRSPAQEVVPPLVSAADGTLPVTADEARHMGIRLAAATAATEVPLATIPAVIAPPANARVAVTAIIPGVVERILVRAGDAVREGQSLATVRSRDLLTMGAALAGARARANVADANEARLGLLAREGIIAGARAEEAAALAAQARAELHEQQHGMAMVHGDGRTGIYALKAPITGRVSAVATEAGASLDGTTAPFIVDAIGDYEVVGQLPERLVGIVRPGMEVRVGALRGRVTAVGGTIDPQTRSAVLKAQLERGASAVSGGAVAIEILDVAPPAAVLVPVAAVTRLGERTVAFVPAAGGFRAQTVAEIGRNSDSVVLASGIVSGDRVVVSGASALKALAEAR